MAVLSQKKRTRPISMFKELLNSFSNLVVLNSAKINQIHKDEFHEDEFLLWVSVFFYPSWIALFWISVFFCRKRGKLSILVGLTSSGYLYFSVDKDS